MIDPARWKIALMATAHLYLNGGDPQFVRGIVKHLNILYNTQFVLMHELDASVGTLEALTKSVGGSHDHHGEDNLSSPDARMVYVEMQLLATRQL